VTTGPENTIGTTGETRHSVEVNGTRLFYRRYGDGDPDVLVHGFCSTSYSCWRVAPALAERTRSSRQIFVGRATQPRCWAGSTRQRSRKTSTV
jgi:hypothetical protein